MLSELVHCYIICMYGSTYLDIANYTIILPQCPQIQCLEQLLSAMHLGTWPSTSIQVIIVGHAFE